MSADSQVLLLRQGERPEVGTVWRDREGNMWRLDRYCDGGPWCILLGVTRFDGAPFAGATWHCDWMLDLVRKAEPIRTPEPCIACGGKGRRSTWVNELGREVEGSCPDCAPREVLG